MPKEQEAFQEAVWEILKVMMFENWLRFYFIEDEKLDEAGEEYLPIIKIPEKSLKKISEDYAEFLPLAERLNDKPIDFETSKIAIVQFINDYMDGKTLPQGTPQKIFSSTIFQHKLQLFNTWVQLHEDQLDARFMVFNTWLELFKKWLETSANETLQ